MPRLALVEAKNTTGDAACIFARTPINIYKGIAANPEIFTAFIGFMRAIGASGAITKAEKELVMLFAAESQHCGYCVAAHTRVAAGTGIGAEEALAARQGVGNATRTGAARLQPLGDHEERDSQRCGARGIPGGRVR